MTENPDEPILEHVGDDRRTFVKKLVLGTAFAVPVVSSFTLTGMSAAHAQTPSASKPTSTSTTTAATTTTTSTTTQTTTAANSCT